MPLTIECKTIEQKHHRYPTIGDWVGHDRLRFIQVSEMGNPHYEFLIAYHEITEMAWCLAHGISEESVTAFDIEFEKNRKPGDMNEPGDDPNCPYYKAHRFATQMEMIMCEKLGLDWTAYERFLNEFIAKNMEEKK